MPSSVVDHVDEKAPAKQPDLAASPETAAVPGRTTAGRMLALQRRVGNRAVGSILAREPSATADAPAAAPATTPEPAPELEPAEALPGVDAIKLKNLEERDAALKASLFARSEIAAIDAEQARLKEAGEALPGDRTAYRDKLRGDLEEHGKAFARASQDFNVLNDPNSPPVAVQQVVLRDSLAPKLRKEISDAEEARAKHARIVNELEPWQAHAKKSGLGLPPEEAERLAASTKEVAALSGKIRDAKSDLDLMEARHTDQKQIQQMLAKRNVWMLTPGAESATGQAALAGTGLSARQVAQTGDVSTTTGSNKSGLSIRGPDGKVVYTEEIDEQTKTYGLSGIGDSWRKRKSTQVGDKIDAEETAGGTKWTPASLGKETTVKSIKTEKTNEAGDLEVKSQSTVKKKGLRSGFTTEETDVHKVGDKVLKDNKKTSGFGYGPGGFGWNSVSEKKSGKEKDGELIEGKSSKMTTNVGPIVDPKQGVGFGANVAKTDEHKGFTPNADADAGRSGGRATSIKTEPAFGGKVVMNVTPWTNPDPNAPPAEGDGFYEVTITVQISASLGVGGNVGKNLDGGEKGSVGGSVTGGFSKSLTFGHKLSAADSKAYIDAAKAGGKEARPSWPEMRIMARADELGWEGVSKALVSLKGGLKDLKEGDSLKDSSEKSIGLKGSASANAGIVSLGVELGWTNKTTVDVDAAGLSDGRVKVTVTAKHTTGHSVGATAGVALASGGASTETSSMKGKSLTLIFPQSASDKIDAIEAAQTVEAVQALAAKFAGERHEEVDLEGSTDSTTAKLGVAGVNFSLTEKGEFEGKVKRTKGADGKDVTTWEYTGKNTGGGNVQLGDSLPAIGSSKMKGMTGEVDEQGQAKLHFNEEDKAFSTTKTLKALGKGLSEGELGVVMNPAAYAKEDVDTRGLESGDSELDAIVGAASNKKVWIKRVNSGRLLEEWMRAGARIAKLGREGRLPGPNPDTPGPLKPETKAAVERELALLIKQDGAYKDAIQGVARKVGTEEGGIGFAFPEGTETLKDKYMATVVKNPLDGPRAKKAKRDYDGAMKDLAKAETDINALEAGLKGFASKYVDAKETTLHTEMLGHVASRRQEIANDKAAIQRLLDKGAGAALPTDFVGPPSEAQQAAAKIAAAEETPEAKRQAEKDGDVGMIKNNIAEMKRKRDEAQRKLGEAESAQNDGGLSNAVKAGELVQHARTTMNGWEALYWKTFALVDKYHDDPGFKVGEGLRKEVEDQHPAGSWGYLNRIANKS